jgi:hypothetical protein
MRRIILECKCDKSKQEFWNGIFTQRMLCSSTSTIILFDNQYLVATIPSCYLGHESMCSFLELVLKKGAKEFYNTNKSWSIDNEFRDLRLRGTELKQYTYEVNYIYYDNANKKYSIVTKKPYVDYILSQTERNNSYNECLSFLKNNNLNLIECLEKLHLENYYHISDSEVSKSIDHLIKTINKKK